MNRRAFISRSRRLAASLLLAWSGLSPVTAAEEVRVGILLSDEGGVYREMASALEAVLADAGVDPAAARSWSLAQGLAAVRPQRLLITVGALALTQALAEPDGPPVIATLIPRDAFLRISARAGSRRLSAVFIDQPLNRQLNALAVSLPERRRVGVILGPESQRLLPELRAAAPRRSLTLVSATADGDRDVFSALDRILPDIEVLLAIPDTRVFNAGTLQNILLASYRRQIPLVGFSPAYLRAGALLTLQSSPVQMAASAAEIIRAAMGGRTLPPARHASEYSLSVNRHVARSLGIVLPADEELTARLRAQEGIP